MSKDEIKRLKIQKEEQRTKAELEHEKMLVAVGCFQFAAQDGRRRGPILNMVVEKYDKWNKQ